MKKTIFNILKFFLLVLACILFGFSIYNCSSSRTSGESLPMPFGFGMAVVVTGSMEPTLLIDDLVIVKPAESYEVDDIVVFHSDGLLVVHRIIEVNEEEGTVITKGDANNANDDPIDVKSIKGEVVKRIKGVGIFIDFFKNPIVVVMVIAAALLLMEYSFRKEKEEKNKKINQIKEEIKQLQK